MSTAYTIPPIHLASDDKPATWPALVLAAAIGLGLGVPAAQRAPGVRRQARS